MSESIYNGGGGGDMFFESGVEIKQESPFELAAVSASVPIPQRRTDVVDFSNDMDLLQDTFSGSFHSVPNIQYPKLDFDNTTKVDCLKMDDDDIFQVDKADLILGPTLAELNANPDTMLDDLNFDDLLLPEDSGFAIQIGGAMSGASISHLDETRNMNTLSAESPCSPYSHAQLAFSPSSQHSSASSSFTQPVNQMPEFMLKMDGFSGELALGQSVPASMVLPPFPTSVKPQHAQLSSSAPTHLTMDQVIL